MFLIELFRNDEGWLLEATNEDFEESKKIAQEIANKHHSKTRVADSDCKILTEIQPA